MESEISENGEINVESWNQIANHITEVRNEKDNI
jgi:hypothetical protein